MIIWLRLYQITENHLVKSLRGASMVVIEDFRFSKDSAIFLEKFWLSLSLDWMAFNSNMVRSSCYLIISSSLLILRAITILAPVSYPLNLKLSGLRSPRDSYNLIMSSSLRAAWTLRRESSMMTSRLSVGPELVLNATLRRSPMMMRRRTIREALKTLPMVSQKLTSCL